MDVAECAERSWAWVLGQVRWDDEGPWIPRWSPAETEPQPTDDRDCLYDGIAGLGVALAEVRLTRAWSASEHSLADAIVDRLRRSCQEREEASLYTGLAGDIVALRLLDPPSVGLALERVAATATVDGWLSTLWPESGRPIVNDIVLGNAGVVLACLWSGDPRGLELAERGAEAMTAQAESTEHGLRWMMSPTRVEDEMPNYSHGTAGVATALAAAGKSLHRADLVDLAVRGAEHLVGIADMSEGGFRLQHAIPHRGRDFDLYTYGWCHGPAGSQHLFSALASAGVRDVRGVSYEDWIDRCLTSIMISGVPNRLRPGFWDNDGRCCGTAGVADVFLSHYQTDTAGRGDDYLAFAGTLAAALLERAIVWPDDPSQVSWQFIEHRRDPPLLDPAVSWMQGAAGISAYLFRHARVASEGRSATRLSLPDDPHSWQPVP
jgi:hypothetical protein